MGLSGPVPVPERASAAPASVATPVGFSSPERLAEHYRKHGGEFGGISEAEYLQRAQALRDRPVGAQLLELVRADGVITRFDRETGDFLAFDPDRTIRTFFRPNDGERYFQRQAKRE
jgi:pyocin large subunit-like protein